jgi:HEAT repeat protein
LEAAFDALKDGDRSVRDRAATLLARIGDRTALKHLRQVLRKEDNRVTKMTMRDAIREIESGRTEE